MSDQPTVERRYEANPNAVPTDFEQTMLERWFQSQIGTQNDVLARLALNAVAQARLWLREQESESIWWCEVHKTQAVDPMFKCYNPTPHGVPRPCRITEKRLVDVGERP